MSVNYELVRVGGWKEEGRKEERKEERPISEGRNKEVSGRK